MQCEVTDHGAVPQDMQTYLRRSAAGALAKKGLIPVECNGLASLGRYKPARAASHPS